MIVHMWVTKSGQKKKGKGWCDVVIVIGRERVRWRKKGKGWGGVRVRWMGRWTWKQTMEATLCVRVCVLIDMECDGWRRFELIGLWMILIDTGEEDARVTWRLRRC